jgi:hypothetical protein
LKVLVKTNESAVRFLNVAFGFLFSFVELFGKLERVLREEDFKAAIRVLKMLLLKAEVKKRKSSRMPFPAEEVKGRNFVEEYSISSRSEEEDDPFEDAFEEPQWEDINRSGDYKSDDQSHDDTEGSADDLYLASEEEKVAAKKITNGQPFQPRLNQTRFEIRHVEAKKRLASSWSAIIDKYSKYDLDSQGDIVDLDNMSIIEDRGHIEALGPADRTEVWNDKEEDGYYRHEQEYDDLGDSNIRDPLILLEDSSKRKRFKVSPLKGQDLPFKARSSLLNGRVSPLKRRTSPLKSSQHLISSSPINSLHSYDSDSSFLQAYAGSPYLLRTQPYLQSDDLLDDSYRRRSSPLKRSQIHQHDTNDQRESVFYSSPSKRTRAFVDESLNISDTGEYSDEDDGFDPLNLLSAKSKRISMGSLIKDNLPLL